MVEMAFPIKSPSRLPRLAHTRQRTPSLSEDPETLTSSHDLEFFVNALTPPGSPENAKSPGETKDYNSDANNPSLSISNVGKQILPAPLPTPPTTPTKVDEKRDFDVSKSCPEALTAEPKWMSHPVIQVHLLVPKPYRELPLYHPPHYTITQETAEISFPVQAKPCLQCEILGLPCDRKHPTCSRCALRQRLATTRNFENGKDHHGDQADLAEGTEPCLARRSRTLPEIMAEKRPLANKLLAPLVTDSEEDWQRKMQPRAELLEIQERKMSNVSWALPMPVLREINATEMWKRVCNGTSNWQTINGDW